jgi:hypothetical protein
MRYEVAALFNRPVNGLYQRSTTDWRQEAVYTGDPENAARRWLWRLTPDERAATVRLIVFPTVDAAYRPYPVYRGPSIEFLRVNGQLEPLEPPEDAA